MVENRKGVSLKQQRISQGKRQLVLVNTLFPKRCVLKHTPGIIAAKYPGEIQKPS